MEGAVGGGEALTHMEVERFVQNLRQFPVEEVGSREWFAQHQVLEKLNIEAHHNAVSNSDPYVMELLIREEKMPLLVHELLAIEAWREKVYPIVKDQLAEKNSMRGYFILYHEATIANMLEVMMYHDYACEAIGEALLDLVDYCVRKVVTLISRGPSAPVKVKTAMEEYEEMKAGGAELETRADTLDFGVAVVGVSMLRYLTEHVAKLPLGVMARLLDTHDVQALVIPLIENPPWTRRTEAGEWQKFIEQKWEKVEPVNLLKLTKHEAQVWLILYNLMCDAECRKRYYFNSHRKSTVLRVRKYLNEVLVDQLPVLTEIQRYMDELSIMEPPATTSFASAGLILEQVAVFRDAIMTGKNWAKIASEFLAALKPAKEDPDLRQLADVFKGDNFDDLLGTAMCYECGEPATKRCSKCKTAWYCSRECQVAGWEKHKALCKAVSAGAAAAAATASTSTAAPAPAAKRGTTPMISEVA